MPKIKKNDSAKAAKVKALEPSKAGKPAKEKKIKKKEKEVATLRAAIKSAPKPVKVEKKAEAPVAKAAKVAPAPSVVFSTEEVSLRAYFIAERRQAMGWPGNSAHDWIEAERQLLAEAKKKTKH